MLGQWEIWELRLPPVPLERNRDQISAWLSQLPAPVAIEIFTTTDGIKIRLYAPPGKAQGAASAWASMTHQQSRWEQIAGRSANTGQLPVVALRTTSRIPNLVMGDLNADPMLAIGGQLRTGLQPGSRPACASGCLGKETASSRTSAHTGILFIRNRIGRKRQRHPKSMGNTTWPFYALF